MYEILGSPFTSFFADPKSHMTTLFVFGSTNMLWGLMSLWQTPIIWI